MKGVTRAETETMVQRPMSDIVDSSSSTWHLSWGAGQWHEGVSTSQPLVLSYSTFCDFLGPVL